ncbi:MAG: hypothetical protein C4334_05845 [Pyrinomonas sp.]|uniref:hypothetical protein n=1 Tax=Pyrinomonas sp. TaxID=2080306 RepID=UPI00333309F0
MDDLFAEYGSLFSYSIINLLCCCLFSKQEAKLIEEGNRVVAKVEAFRKQRGKLPDSLQEIGIEEKLEGPLFYEKIGDNEYRLWFGTELGESVTYNSETRKWQ